MTYLIYHFIILLYKLIFEKDPPYMSQEGMKAITNITDWYASLGSTFITVFGGEKLPHVLQRYVFEKLVEIPTIDQQIM